MPGLDGVEVTSRMKVRMAKERGGDYLQVRYTHFERLWQVRYGSRLINLSWILASTFQHDKQAIISATSLHKALKGQVLTRIKRGDHYPNTWCEEQLKPESQPEQWVQAKIMPNHEVSNWGGIRSKKTGVPMQLLRKSRAFSWRVSATPNTRSGALAAKVVAYHFCPRPKAWGDQVYMKYLDGDVSNISASNLYLLPLQQPGEVWKSSVVVNSERRSIAYYVSDKGRLRSSFTRRPLVVRKGRGQLVTGSKSVPRLMGKHILGAYLGARGKLRIDSLDGNGSNVHLSNLKFVTKSYTGRKGGWRRRLVKTTEEWRDIKGHPNFEVSNLARVRNKRNYSEIKSLIIDDSARYTVTLGTKTRHDLATLVARAFCPMPTHEHMLLLEHVDGNTYDNSVDNLQWVLT